MGTQVVGDARPCQLTDADYLTVGRYRDPEDRMVDTSAARLADAQAAVNAILELFAQAH